MSQSRLVREPEARAAGVLANLEDGRGGVMSGSGIPCEGVVRRCGARMRARSSVLAAFGVRSTRDTGADIQRCRCAE